MAEVELWQWFEDVWFRWAIRAFFLSLAWQGFEEIIFGDALRIFDFECYDGGDRRYRTLKTKYIKGSRTRQLQTS